MNQPAHAKAQVPKPVPHVRSTVFFLAVCVLCLAAAGIGLYNSKSAKADICGTVASQVYGIQTTIQNDRHLIPKSIKSMSLGTIQAGQAFMAKHCPPESLKPPEPEKAGDPHEMLKQLIGTMVQ